MQDEIKLLLEKKSWKTFYQTQWIQ
jgi:hypothetical protein